MEGDKTAPISLCDFLGKPKPLTGEGMGCPGASIRTSVLGHRCLGASSMEAISPLKPKDCFCFVLFTAL